MEVSLSLSMKSSPKVNFLKYLNHRPRLLEYVSSLDGTLVKSASQKAFQSLPDISKAVSELTVLKGVGPATASAILAAYAPDIAPFMSDEVKVRESFGPLFTKLVFGVLITYTIFIYLLNFLVVVLT